MKGDKINYPGRKPEIGEEISMIIKLDAAEKIPKSLTLSALATTIVNKNPRKALNTFPEKRTYVSLAVPVVAKPKILRKCFLTI